MGPGFPRPYMTQRDIGMEFPRKDVAMEKQGCTTSPAHSANYERKRACIREASSSTDMPTNRLVPPIAAAHLWQVQWENDAGVALKIHLNAMLFSGGGQTAASAVAVHNCRAMQAGIAMCA